MVGGPVNKRLHIRRRHPVLEVRLGGGIYRSRDWSLAGFAVSGLSEIVEPDSIGVPVTGYLGLAGDAPVFKFDAVITRIDRDRDAVGFAFTALWPESEDLLTRLFWSPSSVARRTTTPLRPRSHVFRAFSLASRRDQDDAWR